MRAEIKEMARSAEPGTLAVPRVQRMEERFDAQAKAAQAREAAQPAAAAAAPVERGLLSSESVAPEPQAASVGPGKESAPTETGGNLPARTEPNYRRVIWKGGPGNYWIRSVTPGVEDSGPYPSPEAAARTLQEEASGHKLGPVIEATGAAPALPGGSRAAEGAPPAARKPATAPAYGREVNVAVPGEQTSYPARYAIREASDVQPSHNAFSFEPNPDYEHRNDRDYRSAGNAARVAEQAGRFDPNYLTMESATAEHGAPVIDERGNVLGGNSRAMTLARVYQSHSEAAAAYRTALRDRAAGLGIEPAEVDRFKNPVLVREVNGPVDAQRAITDFNKAGAAALSPAERAVKDGKRLSPETVEQLGARIGDVGESSSLAQAMRGDGGAEILNRLVKDGVLTPQEANGLVDERGQLTPEAKDRIAKMLVGRLYDSPAEIQATPPELRNKLERVAPQVLRVEGRPEWSLTGPTREAVSILADARAHGVKNLGDLARQTDLNGNAGGYSPEGLAIARAMQNGAVALERSFRMYANDEALSREGAQSAFFEPPTRGEAFEAAFGGGKSIRWNRQCTPTHAQAHPPRNTSARRKRGIASCRETSRAWCC